MLCHLPLAVNDWAASDECKDLRRGLIQDIQQSQPGPKLGLALAALLCHTRLLSDERTDATGAGAGRTAYLKGFDALLNGQPLHSEQVVLERMMLSILRDCTACGDSYMLQFLTSSLNIETPVLSALDGASDQYWFRRREGATHSAAFREVELLLATLDSGLNSDGYTLCASGVCQVSRLIHRREHGVLT